MTTPGIAATGVRRSFGDVHAVRAATFEVLPGRVTGLVGPNGAGKTTLLLMLASLLAPDAGSIRIDGVDPLSDPQAVRSRIGWMPDALGAWGALTSLETLVVTGQLHDMDKGAATMRAHALLHEVGLADLAKAPARVLSRGQKQRLGLARALVHDPRVLLLDEPASGLDPLARIELRTLLRRFAAEGRTVLVSSHVLSELEEVVDDAVFMVAGETVAQERVDAAARSVAPWRVRLAGADASVAAEQIAAALGLAPDAVRVDRRDVLIGFDSEEAAAAALRSLVSADLAVAEFAAAQGSLERTFLDLGTTAAARVPAASHDGAPASDPSPPEPAEQSAAAEPTTPDEETRA
ncbi:ABC-type multidrug transport system ATPase subunit [Microbacterium terrae]|uniref:ABC transporter ATP-binding protein YxlF n=1 Tax=Microbacterium terrae TaxID=69369 RepID=A0A0M2HIC7_9MICO|nr:ABC transporter ATP-binding protein [Microbacterium terrae]KJL44044.1 putative ABC transporter ATP-binding protein YxlF [Microbacterium terrae]MBP1079421.1 ABC-type multidrug transport system ATPase subunit [Microbacterium terrae]GLJ98821.1 multidrug ABC transporter ATP-binding protein [Microbacterium terrae]